MRNDQLASLDEFQTDTAKQVDASLVLIIELGPIRLTTALAEEHDPHGSFACQNVCELKVRSVEAVNIARDIQVVKHP